MDKAHLMAAVRYVSLNPVRARLAARAEDWPWSSVRAHLAGVDDALVSVSPILEREPQFSSLIAGDGDEGFAAVRRSEGSGRPVGTADCIADLERLLGRPIARRAPGPKPKRDDSEQTQLLS
jgi:putative transposase